MSAFRHRPVLIEEIIGALSVVPSGWLVDATLGGGGHAEALLTARADLRLIAVDRDPAALQAAGERLGPFGDRIELIHAPFSDLAFVLDSRGISSVSAVLADLGVSSHHFDTGERGFSLQHSGPLDMRMDPTCGTPLSERLATVTVEDLADVLYAYGDIQRSIGTARLVLNAWREGADTTVALAARLARKLEGRGRIHPATAVFQALRMWVNDEEGELEALLAMAPARLAIGGALAVIAFHSGEDRMVKQRFRHLGARRGSAFTMPRRKPTIAAPAEIEANPRSRSAKLRVLVRVAPGGDGPNAS